MSTCFFGQQLPPTVGAWLVVAVFGKLPARAGAG